ncbi:hypothetical protein A0130_12190 [Leifsonia xyli]|uniref:glycosyltransferase family 2 protein n=1 Tax=Leifsonia xyli TaxID=1575 RepID=UPI0007CDFB1D|nr:hypothetical protein A0130_12190 [Leifsonia xyli]
MLGTLQSISLVLFISFLTYVGLIVVPYLRLKPKPDGDPTPFLWHAFIPCRDEASVIAGTIDHARTTFPEMHLWVIDDDSDDETAEIVTDRANDDSHVHLVRRKRPQARTGKGDALNAAYAELNRWLSDETDREKVIIAVLDADGALAPNALGAVSAPDVFANPRVGAAQVMVRMKNAADRKPFPHRGRVANAFASLLVRLQDVEFRTVIVAMQSLRSKTGSVGMGGNGQFTRLSVLDLISEDHGAPWHGALLEDYELGLHVLFEGFENRQVHDTYVMQEALPSLRRFVTQRTRWAQGNIQCAKYIPTILRSRYFDASAALESCYFLLLPFIQILGFVVYTTVYALVFFLIAVDPAYREVWRENLFGALALIVVFGIGPFAMWGYVYKVRCEPAISWPRATQIGLGVWMWQAYVMFSVFSACWRLIRKKNGWAKTRRNADRASTGSIAIEK